MLMLSAFLVIELLRVYLLIGVHIIWITFFGRLYLLSLHTVWYYYSGWAAG